MALVYLKRRHRTIRKQKGTGDSLRTGKCNATRARPSSSIATKFCCRSSAHVGNTDERCAEQKSNRLTGFFLKLHSLLHFQYPVNKSSTSFCAPPVHRTEEFRKIRGVLHFHLSHKKPKAPPAQDHKARRPSIRPSAEGFLGTGTCVRPGKCLRHSPVNIFTKSALDMLITTSAVTGGFPKPALPPSVFRSMYQVPPSSPEQTVKRGDKAAESAVPSLFLPVARPLPCPFGAVT